jgi:hypothetical protein
MRWSRLGTHTSTPNRSSNPKIRFPEPSFGPVICLSTRHPGAPRSGWTPLLHRSRYPNLKLLPSNSTAATEARPRPFAAQDRIQRGSGCLIGPPLPSVDTVREATRLIDATPARSELLFFFNPRRLVLRLSTLWLQRNELLLDSAGLFGYWAAVFIALDRDGCIQHKEGHASSIFSQRSHSPDRVA